MNSIENKTQSAIKIDKNTSTKNVGTPLEPVEEEPVTKIDIEELKGSTDETTTEVPSGKRKFLDLSGYLIKIKDFLDNAE
jgi:hypothetical protein